MAVYKIPQDVEADDKFVGPLSFKQFIFVGIAAVAAYLTFLSLTKGFWPGSIILFPFILVGGFLGFPWGRDQPTEIWLAARIRFFLKPRVRIWNQSDVKELVTITAPKKIEKHYTDGLSQNEVSSRLTGLADLLDSRGWAVKNVSSSVYSTPILGGEQSGDRLLDMATLPQEVGDVAATSDMLDEQNSATAIHFEEMIKSSEQKHHQDIMNKMQTALQTPLAPVMADNNQADFWFLQQGVNAGQPATPISGALPVPVTQQAPQAPVMPTYTTFQAPSLVAPNATAPVPTGAEVGQAITTAADEQALLEKIHQKQYDPNPQHGHIKTIMPLGQDAVFSAPHQPALQPYQTPTEQTANTSPLSTATPAQAAVTPPSNPAIMSLAHNDDLNVATLARQANKTNEQQGADGEVIISLR